MVELNQPQKANRLPDAWAFPLSFAQQRLWLLDQLDPGGTAYSIPWSVRLSGVLDRDALAKSLNEIARRHEILRTTFVAVGGEPVQVIAEVLTIPLPLTDLSAMAPDARDRELARAVSGDARQSIHLDTGPLIRARLVRLHDSEHVLLITLHHIVFDGWSRGVFARELAALYEAFTEGRPSPLPELRLQYADFVVWQRNHLKGKTFAKQLAYWKKQLHGAPGTLNLPTDYPRPPIQTFCGTALTVSFSSGPTKQFATFAREHGVSLFMFLLAGFESLLSRYSGDDDILVGTPIANRTRAETESLIGLFANTLVLRGNLAGDPSFTEILRRIKQTALDAYAHQDIPFEKLVEELNPDRSLSHNPLFQVMFSLQNAARQAFELKGLELKALDVSAETAKFDLSIFLSEGAEGLRGRIEYNTDLFERGTIERLWGHYGQLLAGAVANPEMRLSELPLLPDGERQQLLVEWNATAAEIPSGCVHEWFERQAEQTPDAVACVCQGKKLTYRELNERANQVARYLQRQGAAVGQRVGICVDRSLEMLAALLGIQKTGAAYVPIDPGYPAERIRQIVEQAQVAVLLTDSSWQDTIAVGSGTRRICLQTEAASIRQESVENLSVAVAALDPVYVIFTSGSTGKPKGVEIAHRSVMNLLASMARELAMGPADVFPALASFAFDMCIPELYLGLVTGGRVALGTTGLAGDGAALAAFLREVGATVVHATPTTWHLLLEAGFTGKGLKRAVGAEALPAELCKRLLEAEPSLYNFYGPTETTVWSTMHHFRSPEERVVVGRPLANTQVYVLDRKGEPVPVGVEGELYIGGDGVALGYWQQPELTAERFVADRFQAGGRLYRTGDRARYRADGRIEYLGRGDFQVKLRGYRIELGEIEAMLSQHAAVEQCVAVVREDTPGDQRLVGYVVAPAGVAVVEAELRAWVQERLPEYMVPVRVVPLERLPLTANGKVDRQHLPAVDYRREEEEQRYQAARTPVEEVIAGIWAEVLKLERVGIEDDFFQLGGHSLLGTQVVARLREALQVELPLRALFEAPTVRGLGQRVAEMRRGDVGRLLPPLRRIEPRPKRLPLSFAQQRLWFLDQLEPGTALYNVPYLVRLRGPLEVAVLARSLNEVVRRHEALRTRFVLRDDEPEQVIEPWQAVALPVYQVAAGSEDEERLAEARRRVLAEIQTPFDLSVGPLLRAALYRLADEDHIFVLNTHHIVSDRWSLGVLADELTTLYEADHDERASPLAELPVQYADYALWQRQYLDDATLAPQFAFWKQHLDSAPPLLNLPTDRPRALKETSTGAQLSVILPSSLSDAIKDLSRKEGATLFMTTLAAFNVLLARYSGQDSIVVGTPIAGRKYLDSERMIGLFVNTLALHTNVSANLSFRELLKQVRKAVVDAYSHQDLPFEKLVEEIQPERVIGRNPLFQAMLMVQNTGRMQDKLGDAAISAFPVSNQTAKFDLNLIVTETAGGLRLTFEYRTDLFDRSTIERMQRHLENLFGQLVNDPGQKIGTVPLLDASERELILHGWNATGSEFPQWSCVNELFAPVAQRMAGKIAAICGNQQLSYAHLDERSNRFANCLRIRGVAPNDLVGLFVSRSVDMVVALMGILKAGAAYVPIDPGYPKERIAFVLEDANISLLVTERPLSELLPASRLPRLYLDTDRPEIERASAAPLEQIARPDDLAYVIFTSGSTGRPKGVEISHRNLVNFLLSMKSKPGLDATDTVLAVTSLSFDIAALELYLPLLSGAAVIIASREDVVNGKKLAELLVRFEVTLFQATPATWRMLIESGWRGSSHLRVLCGGEPLSPELAGQLLPRCRELWNMYGPTETTVWSSIYEVDSDPDGIVPIGRPIANTRFYVLDEAKQPSPIGVTGDLYIGGEGVARGYLNRPGLTGEKFLPDPFGYPGQIYRTGDLARYLPDGNLLCLGRSDDQVKIRGYRIELGEIESVISQHPGVQACAVLAREDVPGDKRLVAYFVPKAQYGVSPDSLRAHLKSTLADYLLPGAYVKLDSLPLTASGKIDRRALPRPMTGDLGDGDCAFPRDGFELALLEMWRPLLGIESCRMTDNFFELGGHSLLLVRLATMIEKEFNKVIPMSLLFEFPTIEKTAAFLREGQSGFFVPFNDKGTGPAVFFVHSILGDVVGCRYLVRLLDTNQRVYGIQVTQELRVPEFAASVTKMAERYVEELLAYEPLGPYILAGWSAGAPIALEMAQQLKLRGMEIPLLISIDAAPANTGGGTSRWNPLYYLRLICNLPSWLKEDLLFDFSVTRFSKRVTRRCRSIVRGWFLKRADAAQLLQHRIEAFLGPGEYSESAKAFMGALYLGLQRYVPKPYAGRVLLYKVRTESLLRLKDLDRKWKKICPGVEIVPIAGNHVTAMLGEHVNELAKHLNQVLAECRQQELSRAERIGVTADTTPQILDLEETSQAKVC